MPVPALDHVVINTRDRMDAAVETYRRLGFFLTERGHHTLGSINHLMIFPSDYLELIGFETGAQNVRTDILRFPAGLNGIVFLTEDPFGLREDLLRREIPAQEPVEFSRPVRVDGAEHTARFRTVRLAPGTVSSGRVYFCQHLTPELVWRREWQDHPNGACGVTKIVIVAADPEAHATLFAQLLGSDAVDGTPDQKRIETGNFTIEIVREEAVDRRYGDAAPDPIGRDDYMAVLELRTTSIDRAEQVLRTGGVSARRDADGLLVPATEAFNLTLRFVE